MDLSERSKGNAKVGQVSEPTPQSISFTNPSDSSGSAATLEPYQ
jgi:hypothetical protein